MKRRLLQLLGQGAVKALRCADRLFTGSVTSQTEAESIADPYAGLDMMRAHGNIIRTYTFRGWMALGFNEVQAVFRDPRFGSDIRRNKFLTRVLRLAAGERNVSFIDNPSMLNLDPPDHTRLRKLAQQGFLHRDILALEPDIRSIVKQRLDSFEFDEDDRFDQFDIVDELAKPLPALVIGKLLGLPEADLAQFQRWSEALLGLTAIGNDELMEKGAEANEALTQYFKAIIDKKRQQPTQDLICRLISAEEEGDRLSPEEMYSTCVLLLVAGHETTTRLISNGLYTLLTHPDQLNILKDDLSLLPNAIEEMLRFEPPVQLMPRFATEDFEFFGKKIRKNQMVTPVIASANRDPVANQKPNVFDVRRKDIKHVSFGHGIHQCLGMSLARLEARIAFEQLLTRFPNLSLAEQNIHWTPIPLVRGMDHLLVNLHLHSHTKARGADTAVNTQPHREK